MDINQKWQAIVSLNGDTASLKSDIDGCWYVELNSVTITDGFILRSPGPRGKSPQEAIDNTFNDLTNLKPPERILIYRTGSPQRQVKWTGYMWSDYE